MSVESVESNILVLIDLTQCLLGAGLKCEAKILNLQLCIVLCECFGLLTLYLFSSENIKIFIPGIRKSVKI